MTNHVNSQIKNRRRNTVIARGKIINIEHNEDYSYLKLFIRNDGAGLKHTYLTFRYDPKIFYISKNQYVIITAHIENEQNQFKIEKQKTAKEFLAGFLAGNQINLSVSNNRLS
ncbi:hypothetical protein O3613_01000 [Streptococcus salivarius]|uniref:hypothetical protein n=1 Tax=Streptococcus salivarius TaxID=1304 RepID=UPI00352E2E1E